MVTMGAVEMTDAVFVAPTDVPLKKVERAHVFLVVVLKST